jgi:hypothetical protein
MTGARRARLGLGTSGMDVQQLGARGGYLEQGIDAGLARHREQLGDHHELCSSTSTAA